MNIHSMLPVQQLMTPKEEEEEEKRTGIKRARPDPSRFIILSLRANSEIFRIFPIFYLAPGLLFHHLPFLSLFKLS